jgi:hypothetical protein
LKDKYGVSWQVIPTVLMDMVSDPDPERAKRATEAMLAMTKLDIAAEGPRGRITGACGCRLTGACDADRA